MWVTTGKRDRGQPRVDLAAQHSSSEKHVGGETIQTLTKTHRIYELMRVRVDKINAGRATTESTQIY